MLNKSLFTAMIRSTGNATGSCMPNADYKPLYNGNISSMAVNIGQLNAPLLYNYQYDQLNRIISMDAFNGLNQTGNNWTALSKINDYQERVAYDANGNIKTYLRNGTTAGGTPLGMDNLTYNYTLDGNGNLQNNKLTSVNDAVAASNYPNDIDNQNANNYSYDAIGNMTSDLAGGISSINWTVYGKISTITKADGSAIAYTYDAAGNRISKTVTPATGAATTTWYVRDASGNTMAVYTANGSDSLHQTEQDLYGSSRLGLFNRNINADAALPTGTDANLIGKYVISYFTRHHKNYELSNHLGNVQAIVSDNKVGVDSNGDGIIDYYTAYVVSVNDYYPFGSLMPGREYSVANTNYRYGFNGKEKSDEINGDGVDYNYGARILDVRIGKFLSVDPLIKKYPELTSYQFASNSPIAHVDLDGAESEYYTLTITFTRVHRSDKSVMMPPVTTISGNIEHKSTGFLTQWSLYTPNGPLGSGTMHTVQTQTIDVYVDAMGIPQSTFKAAPKTLGEKYEPSAADNKSSNSHGGSDGGSDKGFEGIVLYSSEGQGQETRKGTYTKEMVNIDGIIAFSNVASEVKVWENAANIVSDLKDKKEENNNSSNSDSPTNSSANTKTNTKSTIKYHNGYQVQYKTYKPGTILYDGPVLGNVKVNPDGTATIAPNSEATDTIPSQKKKK